MTAAVAPATGSTIRTSRASTTKSLIGCNAGRAKIPRGALHLACQLPIPSGCSSERPDAMICLAEVKRGLHHKNSAWFSGRDCACCPVVRRRQKLHGCAELVHEM